MANPAGPPAPKKSNVLLWVLLGIAGFFMLMVFVVVGGIFYLARNPATVLTKMISASNPNVEVVSVNKGSQQITLRDKHTGKTYQISFDDAKNGRFTMKGDEGTVTVGGEAKVPAWVPDYPGSNPQGAFAARGSQGEGGTFSFKTVDSTDKVTKFYRDQFQSLGLKINSETSLPTGAVLAAEDEVRKHTVTVIVGTEGGNTTVAVTYATNR